MAGFLPCQSVSSKFNNKFKFTLDMFTLFIRERCPFAPFNEINVLKHRKNCECCPRHSLFKGHNVNVKIAVLNCQKCNQCLKWQASGHKSLGLLFEVVL